MGEPRIGSPVPAPKPAPGAPQARKPPHPAAAPAPGPRPSRDTYHPASRHRGYAAGKMLPQAGVGGKAYDQAALQARIGRLARLVEGGESSPADLAHLTAEIWKGLAENPGQYAKLPEGERQFMLHMALFGTDGAAPTYVARALEGLKGDQAALSAFQKDLDTVLSVRVAIEQGKVSDLKALAALTSGLAFLAIGAAATGGPGLVAGVVGLVGGLGIDMQLSNLDLTDHDKAFIRTLQDRSHQLRATRA